MWEGERPLPPAAPIPLGASGPRTLLPPPSRPGPAQSRSPGQNDAHCDQRHQLFWAKGIGTGPRGSLGEAGRAGRSCAVSAQRTLPPGRRATWPPTATLGGAPAACLATCPRASPAQPCISWGEASQGAPTPRLKVGVPREAAGTGVRAACRASAPACPGPFLATRGGHPAFPKVWELPAGS